MDNRPILSNRAELLRQLRRKYTAAYSASLSHFFKKYSTNPDADGSRYEDPIINTTISSQGLNPFGVYNIFEGLVVGQTKPDNFESNGQFIADNRDDVRTYGFKTPLTFVGPGYDIHGFPAPNYKTGWTASGVYGPSNPDENFIAGLLSGPTSQSTRVSDALESHWLAGPVDMRWDQYRKVWTANYGVYPGYITSVRTLDSTPVTDPQFRANLEYSAVINDGMSTGIYVTGIRPRNYFPAAVNYKVYALPTGWPCLIFHDKDSYGRPSFSIMAVEPPYTVECSSSQESVAASYVTAAALASDPLPADQGGTGHGYYEYQEILTGATGHALDRRLLVAGTGISINWSATGVLTLGLAGDIDFVISSGVNYTITALSGLITPLSIDQGGTGSSTKNFLDLSTSQTAGGYKTFTSGIRLPSGSTTYPALSFTNSTTHGLGYVNGYGLTLHSSGVALGITPTGSTFYNTVDIKPTLGYYPSLRVRQRGTVGVLDSSGNLINQNSHIQTWESYSGTAVGYVNSSGYIASTRFIVASTGDFTHYGEILPPAITGTLSYRLPSQTGTLAIAEHVYRQPVSISSPSTNYSVLSTDEIILATTGITITLPDASTVSGRRFTIKDKIGLSETQNITVTTNPTGQLIDNGHLLVLDINYVSYSVVSDGSKFYLI